MLYKFKSKAAGDVIMTSPVGDAVLKAAGKSPSAQGIFEAASLPAAIAALEAAIAADESTRPKAEPDDDGAAKAASGDRVSLRQRAWPLVEMMKRAQAGNADIVWGV